MRVFKKCMTLWALLAIVSLSVWGLGCAKDPGADAGGGSDAAQPAGDGNGSGSSAGGEDTGGTEPASPEVGSSTGDGAEIPAGEEDDEEDE